MEDDRYSRSVRMHCSTCGGTDFEYDAEQPEGPIRCTSCDRVFSRDELIGENGEVIQAEVEEVKAEIVDDMRKHLKKAFAGNKFIKIK